MLLDLPDVIAALDTTDSEILIQCHHQHLLLQDLLDSGQNHT